VLLFLRQNAWMRIRPVLALTAFAALAVPAVGQARTQEQLVIKVTSVSIGKPVEKDTPPKGASAGDTVVFTDKLVNAVTQFGKKAGIKVGGDRGTMTYTSARSATFLGTATLPGGTLTLKGSVVSTPDGKSFVIPVTGGTGRFAGAHGTVLVGPGTARSLNTYTLTIPTGPVA
jgi:Dirigent-like protein